MGMIEAVSGSGAAQVAAPDDGSVIDALRRGVEGAFARLVDRYHASLRRVARVLGHLGWEQPGWPAEREILSLEARVTYAVRNLPSVVLCAYDVRGLAGRPLLLGGLECHPLTLRRATLRLNEHYVAAEQVLERLSADA